MLGRPSSDSQDPSLPTVSCSMLGRPSSDSQDPFPSHCLLLYAWQTFIRLSGSLPFPLSPALCLADLHQTVRFPSHCLLLYAWQTFIRQSGSFPFPLSPALCLADLHQTVRIPSLPTVSCSMLGRPSSDCQDPFPSHCLLLYAWQTFIRQSGSLPFPLSPALCLADLHQTVRILSLPTVSCSMLGRPSSDSQDPFPSHCLLLYAWQTFIRLSGSLPFPLSPALCLADLHQTVRFPSLPTVSCSMLGRPSSDSQDPFPSHCLLLYAWQTFIRLSGSLPFPLSPALCLADLHQTVRIPSLPTVSCSMLGRPSSDSQVPFPLSPALCLADLHQTVRILSLPTVSCSMLGRPSSDCQDPFPSHCLMLYAWQTFIRLSGSLPFPLSPALCLADLHQTVRFPSLPTVSCSMLGRPSSDSQDPFPSHCLLLYAWQTFIRLSGSFPSHCLLLYAWQTLIRQSGSFPFPLSPALCLADLHQTVRILPFPLSPALCLADLHRTVRILPFPLSPALCLADLHQTVRIPSLPTVSCSMLGRPSSDSQVPFPSNCLLLYAWQTFIRQSGSLPFPLSPALCLADLHQTVRILSLPTVSCSMLGRPSSDCQDPSLPTVSCSMLCRPSLDSQDSSLPTVSCSMLGRPSSDSQVPFQLSPVLCLADLHQTVRFPSHCLLLYAWQTFIRQKVPFPLSPALCLADLHQTVRILPFPLSPALCLADLHRTVRILPFPLSPALCLADLHQTVRIPSLPTVSCSMLGRPSSDSQVPFPSNCLLLYAWQTFIRQSGSLPFPLSPALCLADLHQTVRILSLPTVSCSMLGRPSSDCQDPSLPTVSCSMLCRPSLDSQDSSLPTVSCSMLGRPSSDSQVPFQLSPVLCLADLHQTVRFPSHCLLLYAWQTFIRQSGSLPTVSCSLLGRPSSDSKVPFPLSPALCLADLHQTVRILPFPLSLALCLADLHQTVRFPSNCLLLYAWQTFIRLSGSLPFQLSPVLCLADLHQTVRIPSLPAVSCSMLGRPSSDS